MNIQVFVLSVCGKSSGNGMGYTLSGVGGAPGIAGGAAAWLEHRGDTQTEPVDQCPDDALARFAIGRAHAAERLRSLAEQLRSEGSDHEAGIFDAQAMLVEDDFITDEVTRLVREAGERLEDALDETIAQMRASLEALDDEYLRERAADMDAIGHEIHLGLRGGTADQTELPPGSILLAEDLTPTQTAGLRGGAVAGFATAYGGPTGHTAILARSLGIPAAVGLGVEALKITAGTTLILDGSAFQLIVEPTAEQQADYAERANAFREATTRRAGLRDTPGQLADGATVALWANIGNPAEAKAARDQGAEGIGLFRTEFLFLDRKAPPNEDEQYSAYRAALETMDGRTVVARTLDIGGDKPLPYLNMAREDNPFLGVRGLRLCMQQPALFQTQLRALLRAARHGDLWIMLPMIATAADLAWGREQLQIAANALHMEGIEHRADPPLGIMIETPAAAITADLLARDAAFFSVGSNDLTQYTMAADRGQATLAAQYPHHAPAVLRLIARAAEAARDANIPIGVCGEMAGDPEIAVVLAGLGINELSMVPSAIPAVKERLASATSEQARELATTKTLRVLV